MAVTLKRIMGEAGAVIDDSNGADNLYDVLKGLAETQNEIITQLNQLAADVDAASAFPITVNATDVTSGVTVE